MDTYTYVKLGSWCNISILSRFPVSEEELRYSHNLELRLIQSLHVRGVVSELNIDTVDIVYPRFFHERLSTTYFCNKGSWNGIRIISHIDEIDDGCPNSNNGTLSCMDWSVNDPYYRVSN